MSLRSGAVSDLKRRSRFLRNFIAGLKLILRERITQFAFAFILAILFLGIFGPWLAPYDPQLQHFATDGSLLRTAPPSLDHPLGTTLRGEDVLSQVLHGSRPTMIAGLLGGSIIITIGSIVGVTAGYVGGSVEGVLMRLTDTMYGIPLIPFAIVLAAFFGTGFYITITIIGVVLWRGSARVLRAQVLQIKERNFIRATEAIGAGRTHIVLKHIVPNILNMAVLFFALGIGYSIIYQANLAFLGITDPFTPSWGVIIRNAYQSGRVASAWWWSLPPGILISTTVLCTFLIGRGYEQATTGEARQESIAL